MTGHCKVCGNIVEPDHHECGRRSKATAPVKLTAAQEKLLRNLYVTPNGIWCHGGRRMVAGALVRYGLASFAGESLRLCVITPAGRAWLAARDGR